MLILVLYYSLRFRKWSFYLMNFNFNVTFFENSCHFSEKAYKNKIFMLNNNILVEKTALKTISIEAKAVENLRTSINANFCESVELIFLSKGRVIVTGIGKSAIIAQKIAATLNSTGTPAIFMHAADAIHGDLGMIQLDDIVLCISKSGETPEIKVLIPFLKTLGSKLIGMTSNTKSYLAKRADYLLHTPIPEEADPNNLAPTTSTTTQLVLGDALATSLLALRGFSPADFAQFHPGGALGKQLYLRVYDLYPNNEKPNVQLEASLQEVILEMTSKRLGAAVVLDKAYRVKGMITDGDLRRMLEKTSDISSLTAKDIMTSQPLTINDQELAVKALEIMRTKSITQIIVTNTDSEYVGIVHLHDLIREGLI